MDFKEGDLVRVREGYAEGCVATVEKVISGTVYIDYGEEINFAGIAMQLDFFDKSNLELLKGSSQFRIKAKFLEGLQL